MKRALLRIAACVMVLMMVMSAMAACAATPAATSAAPSTEAATATPTTAPTATPTATPVPTPTPLAPVTITYGDAAGSAAQLTAGVQTDPVSVAMQKATGVSLDWDTTLNPDKIKAEMASGSLPDLFSNTDVTVLPNLIKSNFVTDVSALIDSNGPNIKAIGANALQFSKDHLSGGTGKIYAIPTRITIGSSDSVYMQPYAGFHIRWDYFKEIGSPVLNSWSDAADAIIAIQAKHPTTADGKKTYGLSMWMDWGLWNYTVLSQTDRGIGSFGSAQIALMDKDYNFVDGLMDPKAPLFYDGAFYNKLYRASILDPDSFTQGYSQAIAKFDAGQDISQIAYWVVNDLNSKLSASDADYLSIPVNGINVNAAQYNPVGARYYIISSNCKVPDRAIDVLNWMFSDEGTRDMLDGVKGDTWTVDANGVAALTDKGLKMKSDPNYMLNTGASVYINSTGIDPFSKDSTGKQQIDLFYEPTVAALTLDTAQKEWLTQYGAQSSNDLWHKFGSFAQNSTYSMLQAAQSDAYKRTDAAMVTYLTTAMPKLIMSKDDAAFAAEKAKIIADIQAIPGYQAYMTEAKASIATAKAGGDSYSK